MSGLLPEPAGYAELLEQLKVRVRISRVRAARAANSELLGLYWSVGRDILDRQEQAGWGSRVIDRLATDLRAEFPEQRGWSRRNLHYMRALASTWPEEFVQQPAARLPWGHLMVLLDKLSTRADRDWYAAAATEYGWSRDVLAHQVQTRLAERVGAAPSNFTAALPSPDSDLARQLVRDPYVFDHLALTEPAAERDLEQALMDRLEQTLLAFGQGMAFVGRQVRFDIDGDELVLDLLLFHLEQLRYVVVELKIGRFDPAYVGQLGTYVAVVDDRLRRPDRHAPTVGILLCKGRNDTLVRYALAGAPAPFAVADYTYDSLPPPGAGRIAECRRAGGRPRRHARIGRPGRGRRRGRPSRGRRRDLTGTRSPGRSYGTRAVLALARSCTCWGACRARFVLRERPVSRYDRGVTFGERVLAAGARPGTSPGRLSGCDTAACRVGQVRWPW